MTTPLRRFRAGTPTAALPALALLAAALLTTVLLTPARADSPDPSRCVPPSGASADGPVRIALDWSTAPITPGARPTLGVTVTNTGDTATTDPTLVVVHLPSPNSLSAPAGTDLTLFGTGGSYSVPAGLAAGASVSTTLVLAIHAEDPPNTTQHCDVTSFTGSGHATVPYDVTTGDPVVSLAISTYGPLGAPAGSTLNFGVVEHNAGPSNAYNGATVVTATAPGRTHWVAPLPYRCTADPTAVLLSCTFDGSPLIWRDEYQWPNLMLDPGLPTGTVLTGGELTIANPWDCDGIHRTPFSVTVSAPVAAPAPAS